jgi:hypothetical protein
LWFFHDGWAAQITVQKRVAIDFDSDLVVFQALFLEKLESIYRQIGYPFSYISISPLLTAVTDRFKSTSALGLPNLEKDFDYWQGMMVV